MFELQYDLMFDNGHDDLDFVEELTLYNVKQNKRIHLDLLLRSEKRFLYNQLTSIWNNQRLPATNNHTIYREGVREIEI